MPQLIAMVIVVVGAMIYMFQTFGGTGDKLSGIAQKSSIITEINNIKEGLKIAAGYNYIVETVDTDAYPDGKQTLEGLAELGIFAEQINEQIDTDGDLTAAVRDKINVYNALSFGGSQGTNPKLADGTNNTSSVKIQLVTLKDHIPGIYVNLQDGSLKDNDTFLESQIAKDLGTIATIDRLAISPTAAGNATATTGIEQRVPALTTGGTGTNGDGKFIIYFKDFGASEVVAN